MKVILPMDSERAKDMSFQPEVSSTQQILDTKYMLAKLISISVSEPQYFYQYFKEIKAWTVFSGTL